MMPDVREQLGGNEVDVFGVCGASFAGGGGRVS
jgi:hypothetical protein